MAECWLGGDIMCARLSTSPPNGMSSEDDGGDDDFLVITGAAVADVDGKTSAGKQQL